MIINIILGIWIIFGFIFGPKVALYVAYDSKSFYRILEGRFWDNVQYWILCIIFVMLPVWLLFFWGNSFG